MAKGDIRVIDPGAGRVEQFQVQDRTSSSETRAMAHGDAVKRAADGSPYVILCATGDPEQGTDKFIGIAMGPSTETTTADGVVSVLVCAPDTVLEAKATTYANVDTQSEIDDIVGDNVSLDLTTNTFTIDENEGNDDNVHGFVILGGDPIAGTLRVRPKSGVLDGYTAL